MIPILSSEQVRQVEEITIAQEPISAEELMERAASRCAERILVMLDEGVFNVPRGVVVFAGMGNNGGDGLVVARALHEAGITVQVFRVRHRSNPSPDHLKVYGKAVSAGVRVIDIDGLNYVYQVTEDQLIIDCIFGSGLTHPPSGWLAELIVKINASRCPVIAIDLPTGAVAPEGLEAFEPLACVKAVRTLTFEVPRLALLMPETGAFAGAWEMVPIGLDLRALAQSPHLGQWVEQADIIERLRPRSRFAHKGELGHAAIVAGSVGMNGAAVLAVKGCLRSGAGLVTAHVPARLASQLPAALPDCMSIADTDPDMITNVVATDRFTAVGIGPGIGQASVTGNVVRQLLAGYDRALVLDADALNLVANNREWLSGHPSELVITPHPKEMDRLLGVPPKSAYDRLQLTRVFAREMNCTVVLKGAYTAICAPSGEVYFNSTGNAGMAKGGSGDVLTGLLTGLMAQGYSALDACLIGVYLHGAAGDIAARLWSAEAMRPVDLVDALPEAWLRTR